VGWEGWGPELVRDGKIAPENEIGRWSTIPDQWDRALHETRPTIFGVEEVPWEDGRSGQSAMRRWFDNHTNITENEEDNVYEMFPELTSEVGSHWGPEFTDSAAFESHHHALRPQGVIHRRLRRPHATTNNLCPASDCD